MLIQKFCHSPDSDFCGFAIREMKLSGRDTAERDARQLIFFCKRKTRPIAGSKKRPVFTCNLSIYNRAYRMDDMLCRKIIALRDLRLSGRFLMSLCPHDLCTFLPKLHTGGRMNGITKALTALL